MKDHCTDAWCFVILQRVGANKWGCVCAQDAHKALQPRAQKGRKKKFGPLETKHTVTSVAWLPDSHVVASSGTLRVPALATSESCLLVPQEHPALPDNAVLAGAKGIYRRLHIASYRRTNATHTRHDYLTTDSL